MTDAPEQTTYVLIDPPVGPYSDPDEIMRWIGELESMPQVPGVGEALEQARNWLVMKDGIPE